MKKIAGRRVAVLEGRKNCIHNWKDNKFLDLGVLNFEEENHVHGKLELMNCVEEPQP